MDPNSKDKLKMNEPFAARLSTRVHSRYTQNRARHHERHLTKWGRLRCLECGALKADLSSLPIYLCEMIMTASLQMAMIVQFFIKDNVSSRLKI
jgi:hypothetical protein